MIASRTLRLIGVLLLVTAASAPGQQILYRKDGIAAQLNLGQSLVNLGDIDGDGFADLAVGSDSVGTTSDPDLLFVYSGLSGLVTSSHRVIGGSMHAPEQFGWSVLRLDDLNGDGIPEMLIGAPQALATGGQGDGETYAIPANPGSQDGDAEAVESGGTSQQLGFALALGFDYTGDGRRDPIVVRNGSGSGAMGTNGPQIRCYRSNKLAVILGGTGGGGTLVLWQTLLPSSTPGFSRLTVATIGDIDQDGYDDVVVGSPDDGDGRIHVYSGLTGGFITTVLSPLPTSRFGSSVAAAPGGILVGASDLHPTGTGQRGGVYFVPNAIFQSPPPIVPVLPILLMQGQRAGDHLGTSVSTIDDVDGDGQVDYLFGAEDAGTSAFFRPGAAYVVSSAAPHAVLRTFIGENHGDRFGHTVLHLGDLTADGLDEYVIGADRFDGAAGLDTGAVYVVSPAIPGSTAGVYTGPLGSSFGRATADAGDVDGDGRSDALIGGIGIARVVSGADASVLYQFNGLPEFGASVAGNVDLDGDAIPDFLIGFRGTAGLPGRVDAYSGATGGLLWMRNGSSADDAFSLGLGTTDDLDGDGRPEVVVGAPLADTANGSDTGQVIVLSGMTGTPIPGLVVNGAATGDQMGYAVTGLGADYDGDGKSDFAVGAPQGGVPNAPGYVRLISGLSGGQIAAQMGYDPGHGFGASLTHNQGAIVIGAPGRPPVLGPFTPPAFPVSAGDVFPHQHIPGHIDLTPQFVVHGLVTGDQFGCAISGGVDLSGDGIPDIAVGACGSDVGGAESGSVTIVCGATGNRLKVVAGLSAGDNLGVAVAVAGNPLLNITGDSLADFLAGASQAGGSNNGYVIVGVGGLGGAGVTELYPGSGDDLQLFIGLNGAPPTAGPGFDRRNVEDGDSITYVLASLCGTYAEHPGPNGLSHPILVGQLFTTGSLVPTVPGFPSVHLQPLGAVAPFTSAPIALFGGVSLPFFGPPSFPPGGIITVTVQVPTGLGALLGGQSLMTQLIVSSTMAQNHIFAISSGQELVFP